MASHIARQLSIVQVCVADQLSLMSAQCAVVRELLKGSATARATRMTVLVCVEGRRRTTNAAYAMGQALLQARATVLVMWKTALVYVVGQQCE